MLTLYIIACRSSWPVGPVARRLQRGFLFWRFFLASRGSVLRSPWSKYLAFPSHLPKVEEGYYMLYSVALYDC